MLGAAGRESRIRTMLRRADVTDPGLQRVEVCVTSVQADQLVMAVVLDDVAMLERNDPVRVAHDREPISDDEHAPAGDLDRLYSEIVLRPDLSLGLLRRAGASMKIANGRRSGARSAAGRAALDSPEGRRRPIALAKTPACILPAAREDS